jgi:hypothetical protein
MTRDRWCQTCGADLRAGEGPDCVACDEWWEDNPPIAPARRAATLLSLFVLGFLAAAGAFTVAGWVV